ncbi:TPA: LamG domain-containing protein [Candidatus Poribacteria bacterium]|nr:LamG domain-containing protein [Candidatus Poribacteria bacterium]
MRLVLTIIALSAIICAGAHADITADLTDGLVSAWLFNDGSAADSVGGNDGIIHGATSADGKYGSALSFNGVDNYVEIPDDPSLHLPEGLTVAAWMNVNVGGNHAAICWKGVKVGWGPNFSWRVCTTSDTNMTWGRCPEGTEGWFATDGVIPGLGEWVHVALTSGTDGPPYMRCYVNSEDKTGVSGQDGMNNPPPYQVFEGIPIEIGVGRAIGGTEGNDTYFDGMIDEVLIYNRPLSAGEISELMNTDMGTAITAVEAAGKIASVWGKIKEQ